MDSYPTPAKTQRTELEIKRSRFITTIVSVAGKKQAQLALQNIRREMPDANHHCWAMVAGMPDDIYQQDQSDDGEPKGTAGKPMLNVLQHSGLGNILVVVTRYFGGIKLGSGGLVRAYTQSVTQAFKTLETTQTYIRIEAVVTLPYESFDSFEHWQRGRNIIVTDKLFQEQVVIKLLIPASDADPLQTEVARLGGSITKLDQ